VVAAYDLKTIYDARWPITRKGWIRPVLDAFRYLPRTQA